MLWGLARSIGYWREVVRSGEYARLGVYALEAYGIFKVRFVLSSLFLRARLMMLWHVAGWRGCGAYRRCSSVITWSRSGGLCHDTASRFAELVTSNNPLPVSIRRHCALAPSSSITDSILHVFYSASSAER
jgi:hypothetical protein